MKRVVPGLALAACWLLLLLKGPFLLFFPVVLLIGFIGSLEYIGMALPSIKSRLKQVAFAFLLILPIIFAGLDCKITLSGGLVFSFLLLAGYILVCYSALDDPYTLFVRSVFGLIYVGFLTAHLVLLYQFENGNLWIIVLSAITAGSDTGAYYLGRTIGKHKLCPNISPKKTIEGVVGGLIGGVLGAAIFGWLLLPGVNLFFLSISAMVLVIVGIAGDLTESVLKRYHGIKDSGTLLAGHGGILDRADSLLFAGPLLYYFLLLYKG